MSPTSSSRPLAGRRALSATLRATALPFATRRRSAHPDRRRVRHGSPGRRSTIRPMALRIRQAEPRDRPAVAGFLRERDATRVARRGELLQPGDHPALLAEDEGALLGVITYVVDGADCELLTVHAEPPRRGVGTALLAAAQRVAAAAGCTRLWL